MDYKKESYNGYSGDSININHNYPFGGPLQVLGELLDMLKNKEPILNRFKAQQFPDKRTNYIFYYNPYSPANDGAFGLFNYFNNLEEARNYLAKAHPSQKLENYFGREESKIFYSFHAYRVEWGEEKSNPIEKIKLRLLKKHDLPENNTKQPSETNDKTKNKSIQQNQNREKPHLQIIEVAEVKEMMDNIHRKKLKKYLSISDTPLVEDPSELVKLTKSTKLDTKASQTVTSPNPQQPFSTKYDHLGPLYDGKIAYDGPKVKVHNFTTPFQYFDIYQNFLAQWDPREEVEKNLKQVTEYLTGEASLAKFLENVEKTYQYFRNLVVDRSQHHAEKIKNLKKTYSNLHNLEQLTTQLKTWKANSLRILFSKTQFRSGDLIDLEGYLGTGLFLIHHDPIMKQFVAIPTLGDRGHMLPEPGFNLVKTHGLEYFMDSEISSFQISHLRRVYIRDKESGEYILQSLSQPIYLEATADMEMDDEMDEVIIDGKFMFGYVTEQYI